MMTKKTFHPDLSDRDWHKLKNAYLAATMCEPGNPEPLNELPARLQDHPIVELTRKYLRSNQTRYLNEAARLLVPGCDNPHLYLMKC